MFPTITRLNRPAGRLPTGGERAQIHNRSGFTRVTACQIAQPPKAVAPTGPTHGLTRQYFSPQRHPPPLPAWRPDAIRPRRIGPGGGQVPHHPNTASARRFVTRLASISVPAACPDHRAADAGERAASRDSDAGARHWAIANTLPRLASSTPEPRQQKLPTSMHSPLWGTAAMVEERLLTRR
jgi:hypothetical protein